MTALETPATTIEPQARLSLGRVISRTFGALGGNFVTFLLLAILLAAIPGVLIGFGTAYFLLPMMQGVSAAAIGLVASLTTLGTAALGMIPTYILIGALTQGSIVHYNGGRASFGECLATGFRFLLPLLGVGFLTLLGVFLSVLPILALGALLMSIVVPVAGSLGALLMIVVVAAAFVPAIVFVIRWSVAAPSLVVERTSVTGAFKRSSDLTSNNRWTIFFLGLIWVVISLGIQSAIGLVRGPIVLGMGDSLIGPWLFFGFTILYSAFNTMILATGQAALYYELRVLKEGATSEELAKIFE